MVGKCNSGMLSTVWRVGKDWMTGGQNILYHKFGSRVVGVVGIQEEYFSAHFSSGNRYPVAIINVTWDRDC